MSEEGILLNLRYDSTTPSISGEITLCDDCADTNNKIVVNTAGTSDYVLYYEGEEIKDWTIVGTGIEWEDTDNSTQDEGLALTSYDDIAATAEGEVAYLVDYPNDTINYTLSFEDENGREFKASEIVTHSELQQQLIQLKEETMNIWTIPNILIVALIAIIVYKVIIPKLNLRYLVRLVANRIYKPAKKEAETIQKEWEEAVGEE